MAKLIREWRPDLVILVDFPDFNLRLARVARDEGIATLYYIPPKVWAWRSKRIKAFRHTIDRIAAIFPFEPSFHANRSYRHTHYVGHPFVERFREIPRNHELFRSTHDLPAAAPIVALLPGSRRAEIARHWDVQREAFAKLSARYPDLWGVCVVPTEELASKLRSSSSVERLRITVGNSDAVLAHATVGVLKSGTCTLEAAFIGLPFVCIYRASPLSGFLARLLVSISEVSLVNIVRPHTVRELLQRHCTPEAIVAEVSRILDDSEYRTSMNAALEAVRHSFERPPITENGTLREPLPAADEVARLVLQVARPARPPRGVLKQRLTQFLQPYRRTFIGALLCMVAFGASDGVVPFLVKEVLDKVFQANDPAYLYLFPLLLIALSALRGAADFGQQYLMSIVGHSVVRDLRYAMNDQFLKLGPEYFIRNPSGDMLARITGDVLLVRTLLTDSFASMLRDSIRIVALAGVAVWMDPTLALIAIIVVPIGLFPMIQLTRRLRDLGRRGQDGVGALTARLQESILGSKVVKIFCNDDFERHRFADANQALTKVFITSDRVKALNGPINEVLASVAVAAVILYGGTSVLNGTRSQGSFIGFLIAIFLLYDPWKKVSRVHAAVQQSLAGAARVFEVLDTTPTIQEPSPPLPLTASNTIEVRGVSYRYGDSSAWALRDISLTIPEGSRIALVGLSGSGKSTLADVIPRFIDPTEGIVKLGGVDLRTASLADIRSRIAMVSQHTFLFNDSIWNNIRYGNHDASSEDVLRAAEQAYAIPFINALPERFDTVVGEGGFALSGGERQRLAIARAILKNAPVLILDEATASLDNRSEREVQQALDTLMEGRTTIVVAHRLSTIVNADRIVVMKEGRILEQGTHTELLALGGEYAALHALQAR
jgi:subfamily B ATP-binding cassette protein MsbA